MNLNRLFNGLDLKDDGKSLFDFYSFNVENDEFDCENHKNLSHHFLNNLPKTVFNVNNGSKINPRKCLICWEKYEKGDEITKIPCNHWFHSKCILTWLSQENNCPICNFELKEEKEEEI